MIQSQFNIRFTFGILLCSMMIGMYSCASTQKNSQAQSNDFLSYLEIAVDENGSLPEVPYVLEFKNKDKQLLVIGTIHSQDR